MPTLATMKPSRNMGAPKAVAGRLRDAAAGHQQVVQGELFEERDFDSHADDLTHVALVHKMKAAGAEVGQGHVVATREFEACGYERGVEVDDETQLKLKRDLVGGAGDGAAVRGPNRPS